MEPTPASSQQTFAPACRWAKWVALSSAGVYIGLSLYVPPPAVIVPPPLGAGWSERLFPGVPEAWVLARIVAVVATILFAALAARGTWQVVQLAQAPVPRAPPAQPFVRAALVWGCLQLLLGLGAGHMPRAVQLVYILALAGPALILYVGDRQLATPPLRPAAEQRTPWPAVFLVVAVWLAVRLPGAEHSHWLATATDCFMPFDGLRETLHADYQLLTRMQRPGFTSMLSFLQGPLLLGLGPDELTPAWMQRFQTLWAVVAALVLATLTARCIERSAAPVAVAVFLFSPAESMTTVFLAALFLGPLLAGILALLWVRIAWDRAPWAIVACAGVAGASITHPSVAPLGVITMLALATIQVGTRPMSWLTLATAGVVFAATVVPGLPSPSMFAGLSATYVDSRQMWAGIHAGMFGYIAPSLIEFQNRTGATTVADIVLGMLLAPWMTPRTPLRLWGDVWLEPVGAALCAVGLGVVLANVRRSYVARGVGLFFAVTLAPGFLSSYDRPSISRAMALPLTTALVAAIGQTWLSAAGGAQRRRMAAATACLASGVAGVYVYDFVNPRILASSATAIAIETMSSAPKCLAARIIVRWDDLLRDNLYVDFLPRCPMAIVRAPDLEAHLGSGGAAGLIFWSPGMEDEAAVAARICGQQPQARLFLLHDSAGLSRVFAAALGEDSWQPPLARERWSTLTCGSPLPTESSVASETLTLSAPEETLDERIERLRATALRTFVQTELYSELARALLRRGQHPKDAEEAAHWADRVAAIRRWEDVDAARLRRAAGLALGQDTRTTPTIVHTITYLRGQGRHSEADELAAASPTVQHPVVGQR